MTLKHMSVRTISDGTIIVWQEEHNAYNGSVLEANQVKSSLTYWHARNFRHCRWEQRDGGGGGGGIRGNNTLKRLEVGKTERAERLSIQFSRYIVWLAFVTHLPSLHLVRGTPAVLLIGNDSDSNVTLFSTLRPHRLLVHLRESSILLCTVDIYAEPLSLS